MIDLEDLPGHIVHPGTAIIQVAEIRPTPLSSKGQSGLFLAIESPPRKRLFALRSFGFTSVATDKEPGWVKLYSPGPKEFTFVLQGAFEASREVGKTRVVRPGWEPCVISGADLISYQTSEIGGSGLETELKLRLFMLSAVENATVREDSTLTVTTYEISLK